MPGVVRQLVAVGDDAVPPRPGPQVGQRRRRRLVEVEPLGGGDDQGLGKGPVELPAEHVEELGRGGGRDDEEVGARLCVPAQVAAHCRRPRRLVEEERRARCFVTLVLLPRRRRPASSSSSSSSSSSPSTNGLEEQLGAGVPGHAQALEQLRGALAVDASAAVF